MAKQDLDNYPQKVLETYDFIEKLFGNGERFYETNEVMSDALLNSLDDLLESDSKSVNNAKSIFKWLLGEEGEFPEREEGQGAYYWRTELRRRLDQINMNTKPPF